MGHNYKRVYNPKHEKSHRCGLVYEHIIMAEKSLGRKLKKNEIVHYEDENKRNNSIENLFVFINNENHSRYHKTGIKKQNKDGTWYAPKILDYKECLICHKKYISMEKSQKYCSPKCSQLSQRKVNRPSKEQILKDLEKNSYIKVGKKYNVSDNTIRKWLKSYD